MIRSSPGGGRVAGLGLLPTLVTFDSAKHLGTMSGEWRGRSVSGYQIHHGVVILDAEDPEAADTEPFLEGFRRRAVWGSTWHGVFENDEFRRAWLTEVAVQAQVAWHASEHSPGFSVLRETMLDRLADAIEQHLDTDHLFRIIEHGTDPDLPFIPPGAP